MGRGRPKKTGRLVGIGRWNVSAYSREGLPIEFRSPTSSVFLVFTGGGRSDRAFAAYAPAPCAMWRGAIKELTKFRRCEVQYMIDKIDTAQGLVPDHTRHYDRDGPPTDILALSRRFASARDRAHRAEEGKNY